MSADLWNLDGERVPQPWKPVTIHLVLDDDTTIDTQTRIGNGEGAVDTFDRITRLLNAHAFVRGLHADGTGDPFVIATKTISRVELGANSG
jgi:hypothetical protein